MVRLVLPCLLLTSQALAAGPAAVAVGAGIGKVDAVQGTPQVVRSSGTVALKPGTPLFAGDQVQTGAAGKVRAILADESVLALGPDSQMVLTRMELTHGRTASFKVITGKFWMKVAKWLGGDPSHVEVATASAVAGVRGTTLWGDTQVDAICALEGQVEVKNLRNASVAPAQLTAGHCAAELSQGKNSPLQPSSAQVQGYLQQVLIP